MRLNNYKGFEISVIREDSVIGNEMFYWAVVRNSDGYIMHEGRDYIETFETDEGKATVRSQIKEWKQRVDKFLSIPPDHRDDKSF